MKTKIVLLFLLGWAGMAFGQKKDKIDSITTQLTIPEIETLLSKDEFKKIVNKEFNSVMNSSGKTTIGNYAAADINDGRLVFNATKNFKNGDMLSVNASGSVTDGFFAIFNQSKINSNVGVNFKYNMRLKSSSILFHEREIKNLSKKKSIATSQANVTKSLYIKDSILLFSKLKLLRSEISDIQERLKAANLDPTAKARYEYQIALKNMQTDSLLLKKESLPSLKEIETLSISKEKNGVANAIDNFNYTGIFFHWISLGAGFQNNNFNYFTPSLSYENQITKKNYVGWKGSIEYNYYEWNQYSKPTHYLLIGFSGGIDDNFSDLSKTEINESYNYGETSSGQRTSTKKFNAYQGTYKTNLSYSKLYIDYYRFILENTMALHIYPQSTFKEESKPQYDAGIGLLYSFKDLKKDKSKLHVELYFNLIDLTNSNDSELAFLKRNEIGLRLSIPVAFLNF
ncbi:hypothetical protein EU348_06410 [Chryseobacterium indologenes]|uniref:Uncharacterized protein n=1 Tax=Chryseobacterium indologenes TaxID=253 RepID=A0A411DKG7_CHRID|nr:hypothetical protein EU348_06410 [Chryseobacterium indologenes]